MKGTKPIPFPPLREKAEEAIRAITASLTAGRNLFAADRRFTSEMQERFFDWLKDTAEELSRLFWSNDVQDWFNTGKGWSANTFSGLHETRDDRVRILEEILAEIRPHESAVSAAAQFEYDVCLSYAREQRAYVSKVADALRAHGVRVFFDDYEQIRLWGRDLYSYLTEVYRDLGRYCVMFISKEYAEKRWTSLERQGAQARAFRENREYLLPARFDATEVPGLNEAVGYINLNKFSPEEFADLIERKLSESTSTSPALPPPVLPAKRVITFPQRERWDITRGCIEFTAVADGTNITCRISEEALQDYFEADTVPTMLPAFRSHRAAIEAIARLKIQHGVFHEDFISITTSDFSGNQAG